MTRGARSEVSGVSSAALAAALTLGAVCASAQTTTTAGEFTIEPPTLLSTAFIT